MRDMPHIAPVAALIGDAARADMLTALMADRALTATELAMVAGVTRQTASAHLAKLCEAGLVIMQRQGRHRYFRLSGHDVAVLIEALMGVAFRTGAVRPRAPVRAPALRKARLCYDHMAGDLAVAAFEAMLMRGWFCARPGELALSGFGRTALVALGVDAAGLEAGRRVTCRMCADWGEGRQHLAGALGARVLDHVLEAGWAVRDPDSRALRFSAAGEAAFRSAFLLD
ncbi:helix-turn-helix transcriptional regulator [Nitrogeniibacter mangrovi]|uniref:Helix-turn-helix transcriptional regulator n=1 Tax=Nitrogeniibacter mangrovi TaxID=2016596 RepID=A0A6C1B4N8_9RHOO|nr:helix-turn-helix domain-containing protein [Nitrogeniibacter mangrovi]QID17250.1 helix-turn-helix transcriptional regulator [Nitrogeniibacter mangrovi]